MQVPIQANMTCQALDSMLIKSLVRHKKTFESSDEKKTFLQKVFAYTYSNGRLTIKTSYSPNMVHRIKIRHN